MSRRAFTAFLLVLAACTSNATPPTDFGAGTPLPSERERERARERERGPRPRPATHSTPVATPEPGDDPVYRDRGPVGAMGGAYVRSARAKRLVVEIDYVRGRRPSQGAIEHLTSILRRETDKPGGVEVRVDDEIAGGEQVYSVADIVRLEGRHRDVHSRGETASMWIAYLDGRLMEDTSALAVAYRASGAAVFADQVQRAATLIVTASAIERAVLVHETGHLFGLVHISYDHRHAHEDPEHPGHSRHRDSVMYWAIEDISIASILGGGPPDDFDGRDREDLALLRRGDL